MQAIQPLWVLGHKVRLWDTDDSYGLVEVTSPAKTAGPPPHHHDAREFFLVLKGKLDVMENGAWKTMKAGSFAELSPGTVHTFANNSDEDAVWITGWRPKGFQQFFREFGVPIDQERAREASVAETVIHRVMAECKGFGMHVSN